MKIILQRNDEIIERDEQNLSYRENSQHNLESQNYTINNEIASVNDTVTTANNVSVEDLFIYFIYLFHIFKEGSPSAYIKTDFQGALRPKI